MKIYQKIAIGALVSLIVLIFVGAVVRASGAGMGCPDWPTCWGCLIPPTDVKDVDFDQLDIEKFQKKAERHGRDPAEITVETLRAEFNPVHTWTEYINRLTSLPLGILTLATFIGSFAYRRSKPSVFLAALLSLILLLVNAWMGARIVYTGLQPGVITLHMALAIMMVCSLVYVVWKSADQPRALGVKSSANKGVYWTAVALFVLILIEGIMGSQVRELTDELKKSHAEAARSEWVNQLEDSLVYLFHRSFSWLILILAWVYFFTTGRLKSGLRWMEFSVLAIVLAQMFLGLVLSQVGILPVVQVLHIGLSSILVAVLFGWLLIARAEK